MNNNDRIVIFYSIVVREGAIMKHVITGNKDKVVNAIMDSVLGYKSKRNRDIMLDHYLDGLTFEEIADKYSMSVRHIKKIYYDNEKIVIEHLNKY